MFKLERNFLKQSPAFAPLAIPSVVMSDLIRIRASVRTSEQRRQFVAWLLDLISRSGRLNGAYVTAEQFDYIMAHIGIRANRLNSRKRLQARFIEYQAIRVAVRA